ncbi:hypothetical protein IWW38_005561, partial [Coemansia aciculifera]
PIATPPAALRANVHTMLQSDMSPSTIERYTTGQLLVMIGARNPRPPLSLVDDNTPKVSHDLASHDSRFACPQFAQPALPNDAHIAISRRTAPFDYVRPLQVQPSSALRTKSLNVVASRAALPVEESVPETVRASSRVPSAVPRQKLRAEDLILKRGDRLKDAENNVVGVLMPSRPLEGSGFIKQRVAEIQAAQHVHRPLAAQPALFTGASVPEVVGATARAPSAVPRKRLRAEDLVLKRSDRPTAALPTMDIDVDALHAPWPAEAHVPEIVGAMAKAPSAVPRKRLRAKDLVLKRVAQPDIAEDDVEKALPPSRPQYDSSLAWRTLSQLEADEDEEWSYHMQRSSTIFWRDLARAL